MLWFGYFFWPPVLSIILHFHIFLFLCHASTVLIRVHMLYFLTAGLMSYWAPTCGTQRLACLRARKRTRCGRSELIYDSGAPALSVGSRCREPTLWLFLPSWKRPDAALSWASSRKDAGSGNSCVLRPRSSTATFPHKHVTLQH